jgi:hypothetical protein
MGRTSRQQTAGVKNKNPTPLLSEISILRGTQKYNLRSSRIHENVKMKLKQL